MAKRVRPGLTNPARFKGRQESADLIRRQPAYPIRARGQAPLTEAECMAAISTCFNRNGKSAWQRGASMYELAYLVDARSCIAPVIFCECCRTAVPPRLAVV